MGLEFTAPSPKTARCLLPTKRESLTELTKTAVCTTQNYSRNEEGTDKNEAHFIEELTVPRINKHVGAVSRGEYAIPWYGYGLDIERPAQYILMHFNARF